MPDEQGQRIKRNCELIWGIGDYDLDVETDDWVNYVASVKRDYISYYGPLLTMTPCCPSPEAAWNELDRMLSLWAKQKLRGRPMTQDERLEIFGGPNGKMKPILRAFAKELKLVERQQ
ncbi:hypothetical protein BBAD15_g7986 [Beauveria bassiana D1-5]|uniref:Uncharacterized protein n=1 Tax=Beauveria bassiana D1-5 TaxID=1245745 RepID=A0A0A2VGM1_BEABA|nr:hypothetical protein BBAD15_g7986 [Beauveria bassiana D1-5]